MRLKNLFGSRRHGSSGNFDRSEHDAIDEEANEISAEFCTKGSLMAGVTFHGSEQAELMPSTKGYSSSLSKFDSSPTQPIPAVPPPDTLELAEIFTHVPLESNIPSIRLVQVLPDVTSSGYIQCLINHSLMQDRPYICLSYEWGTEQNGGQIFLNGRLIDVRVNLLEFLVHASKHCHSTDLWIDALCIDQQNDTERSHQVRQMGAIYSNAEKVFAWLGNDIKTANILATLSRPASERARVGHLSEHEDLIYLGHNSYWSRAWITQEVSLARSLRLLAREVAVDEQQLPRSARFRMTHFGGTRRKDPQKENLLAVLHKFRSQKCHVKRDIVYSLLALCRDGPDVKVDYSTPDSDVIQSIVSACTNHLCFCSGSIIATALDLRAIDERQDGGVIVHHARYKKHGPSTGVSICPDCSMTLLCDPLPAGYSICLRNFCPGMLFHIFWYEVNGWKARLCVLDGFHTRYMSTFARLAGFPNLEVSAEPESNTCSLRLPLSFLVDLGPGVWNSSYPSELDIHLEKEKGFMSLHDPSQTLPTCPFVWVENRPAPATD